jgi:tetratricopeptide (TPR) repeat protein
LGYFGKNITQEAIAQDIYLIPVHGVLNIDLENYAKAKGLWTHVSYDKGISKIKENIKRNIPVLVLVRSSSIPFRKAYHYLVLIGYEDEGRVFIAHSGKKANEIISYKAFLKKWAEAEYWSLAISPKERVDWQLDAQGYNNLGLLYEKDNELDTAIRYYELSIDKSREPETLFNLGNAYLKKREYESAISYYKEAIGLDPEFADCYNNLAYTYMEKNLDLDEAIGYAKQALELKPSNKVYYLDTLGMIQLKKGLTREAIDSFEEATELAVDKKIGSLVYYHLGLAKLKDGLDEEAKEHLHKSLELDPHSEAKETLKGLL